MSQNINSWNYIVNVTESVVGHNKMQELISNPELKKSFDAFQTYVRLDVADKVRAMSHETLGRIIATSSAEGTHHDSFGTLPMPRLIGLTGLSDISDAVTGYVTGRGILERIAIRWITCVAYDLCRQGTLALQWAKEAKAKGLLD